MIEKEREKEERTIKKEKKERMKNERLRKKERTNDWERKIQEKVEKGMMSD